ncbi:hypothetical protein [Parabacteroides gordonii]|jgi:hypothetical protein|uniref:hypothetical protein n=1 Tax=Parabacteroides gordonii TaxID=574930 RepID=UPI00241F44EB|nr:hypothetical protein [Parabacteroides gordonii]
MINEKLYTLYYNRLNAGSPCVLQQLRQMRREGNPPAYPLLLKVNEERYNNADLKVMVFGQETNGWEHQVCPIVTPVEQSSEIIDITVKGFMDYYRKFLDGWGINSPFWHYLKRIQNTLSVSLPDKTIEIVWNNIYKIGNKEKGKNRPVKQIRDFENEYFNLIREEIEILKPDVIIFLTGPNYENRVKKIFPIVSSIPLVSSIRQEELSKFQFENGVSAYRTSHPNYLQLSKKAKYIDFLCDDLLEQYV